MLAAIFKVKEKVLKIFLYTVLKPLRLKEIKILLLLGKFTFVCKVKKKNNFPFALFYILHKADLSALLAYLILFLYFSISVFPFSSVFEAFSITSKLPLVQNFS